MSRLQVDVEVNTSKVAPGLNASTQAIKKWAGDIKGQITSAFSGAAIAMAAQRTLDSIQGMGDAAERMGRTTQEVQLLAQMARLAGRELGNVELMLNNIAEAQVDALAGNTAKMSTFEAAGFNKQTLANTSELGVLERMASSFSNKSIPEMRSLGVSDIVGKKGMGTFAAMQGDLSNFSQTLKEKSAAGDLLNPEQIAFLKLQIDMLSVQFEELFNIIKEIGLPYLNTFLFALNTTAIAMGAFSKGVMAWIGNFISDPVKAMTTGNKLGTSMFKFEMKVGEKKMEDYLMRMTQVRKGLRDREESSNSGPGQNKYSNVDKDSLVYKKLDVPDKVGFKPEGLQSDPYLTRGGFLGTNLGLINQINKETNDLLRKIERNTRERNEALGTNAAFDILARFFGITTK